MTDTHKVHCHSCRGAFDAFEATWCSCLVSERSLVCPSCLVCFCKAPAAYKQRFWREAPKALWDRKFQERTGPFEIAANPEPEAAIRPLVMIVDDEPDIQKVAVRAIQSLGYGVVLAKNGEEGLELARRYKPDFVLTDALMPRMDGREMTRQLKAETETAGIKVAVMTSLYTSAKYQAEGYKVFKVDDYLAKPLEFQALKALLEKHLA
jgi:CheY-like chemotaxis protein